MAERNSNGTFKKGTCPNPGGRPKGVSIRVKEACKKYNLDPFMLFAKIATDKKESTKDRMYAAKVLIEFEVGKPIQQQIVELDTIPDPIKFVLNIKEDDSSVIQKG